MLVASCSLSRQTLSVAGIPQVAKIGSRVSSRAEFVHFMLRYNLSQLGWDGGSALHGLVPIATNTSPLGGRFGWDCTPLHTTLMPPDSGLRLR